MSKELRCFIRCIFAKKRNFWFIWKKNKSDDSLEIDMIMSWNALFLYSVGTNASNSHDSSTSISPWNSESIELRLDDCIIVPFNDNISFNTIIIGFVQCNISISHLNGEMIPYFFPLWCVRSSMCSKYWCTCISISNDKFCSKSTSSNNFPFLIIMASVTVGESNTDKGFKIGTDVMTLWRFVLWRSK